MTNRLAQLEGQQAILKGRAQSLANNRRALLKEISNLKMKLATTKHHLANQNIRLELKVQKLKRSLNCDKGTLLTEKKKQQKKKPVIMNRPRTGSKGEKKSAKQIHDLQIELVKTREKAEAEKTNRKTQLKQLKTKVKNEIANLKCDRKSAMSLLQETENKRRAVVSQIDAANNKKQELSELVRTAQLDAKSLNSQMSSLLKEVWQLKKSLKQARGVSSSSSYTEIKKLITDLKRRIVGEKNRNKRLESSFIEASYFEKLIIAKVAMRVEQNSVLDRSIDELSTFSNVQKETVKELEDAKRRLLVKLEAAGCFEHSSESLTPEPNNGGDTSS